MVPMDLAWSVAGMFGLKGSNLQLEDEIAMQADVVEEQVDVEGLPIQSSAPDSPRTRIHVLTPGGGREDGSTARVRSPAPGPRLSR